jgi:hypothetical protein
LEQLMVRLNRPAVCSSAEDKQTAVQPPPQHIRKACPARVCRGALGFRARQTRKQEYSVVNHQTADTTSRSWPRSKQNLNPKQTPVTPSDIESPKSIFEANTCGAVFERLSNTRNPFRKSKTTRKDLRIAFTAHVRDGNLL